MLAIPNLPDNINKLFLSIALILIGFGFYSIYFPSRDQKREQELENKKMEIVNERYETLNQIKKTEYEIALVSSRVSKKYNVKSPYELLNDSLIETRKLDSTGIDSIIEDSLFTHAIDLSLLTKKHIQSFKKQRYVQGLIYAVDDFVFENIVGAIACLLIGFFLLFTGLIGWQEDLSKGITERGQKPIQDYSVYCQSCARNFTYFLKRGTTKKGKKSKLFCTDCYENGKFTNFLTKETIEEYQIKTLQNRKRKDRKRIKRRFTSITRWKKDEFEAV